MTERELRVDSAGVSLAGTFCLPGAETDAVHTRHPVVLMVHGSGPFDRNENSRGQVLNAFNAIAHYLAERGIASLRYDKRGCGDSEGDYYAAGHSDLVNDAVCWARHLAEQPECDVSALYVLGHSEGTAIAAQVSLRLPQLAGIVLLCPFVQNLEQILMQQAQVMEHELAGRSGWRGLLPNSAFRALGVSTKTQARTIAKLKTSTRDTIRIGLQKVPARWYREVFALDMKAVYAQIQAPVLILGGAKDLQVDPADVGTIAQLVQGEVTAEVVDDLTHLLRLDPGKPSLVGAQRLLVEPLEPVVIEAVCIWLQERSARRL